MGLQVRVVEDEVDKGDDSIIALELDEAKRHAAAARAELATREGEVMQSFGAATGMVDDPLDDFPRECKRHGGWARSRRSGKDCELLRDTEEARLVAAPRT